MEPRLPTSSPSVRSHSSRLDQREGSFSNCLGAMHSCCTQARDAARVGRYNIAHELFQEAIVFFDRARAVSSDDEENLYLWPPAYRLKRARRELDECAAAIYTDPVGLESRA